MQVSEHFSTPRSSVHAVKHLLRETRKIWDIMLFSAIQEEQGRTGLWREIGGGGQLDVGLLLRAVPSCAFHWGTRPRR